MPSGVATLGKVAVKSNSIPPHRHVREGGSHSYDAMSTIATAYRCALLSLNAADVH
jgi:hypothetical protein